jgi:hypothetical protein
MYLINQGQALKKEFSVFVVFINHGFEEFQGFQHISFVRLWSQVKSQETASNDEG